MIQQIMVYGIAVAAVLGVAALGLERLAALQGRPRRTAWILALLLSVLLPLLMIQRAKTAGSEATMLVPPSVPTTGAIVAGMPTPVHTNSLSTTPQADSVQAAAQPMLQTVTSPREWHLPQLSERSLLQAWAIASLLSGLYLIGAHLRLRRRISGWQRATLLGRPVLISESMGPALVGVFRPRMVVPRWLLEEPANTQSLILEHERQHIGARDPLLIRAAVVLLAALPWNLPLWWQWRRMRQAIELDCDARVLRTGAEARSYGEVLLSITRRATRMPSGVVAMSEPVAALERRIQNLLPDPVRYAALQAAGAIALLLAGVGAALAMDAPTLPALASPIAVEVMPPAAAPRGAVLAAAAAAPAPRANSTQRSPTAAAVATPNDGGMSPRDMALRAAVERYPELVNGPPQSGPYYVTIVLRADGTAYRTSLSNLNIIPSKLQERMEVVTGGAAATYGSGAMAGVVNQILNRRVQGMRLELEGLRPWQADSEQAVSDGSQTARIPQGLQIADVGKASSEFEVLWHVLPADFDESRDAERVTSAVRAKHSDLLYPSRSPRPDIQLLTVFMTEDGQIAQEAVELLAEAQYAQLNPQPVTGDSITGAFGSGPYNFYNPPPVPAEAFKVLGLDAAQIGRTGFLRVMPPLPRDTTAHAVLVRFAWPRRIGEPIGGKTPAMAAAPTAQRTQFVPAAPAPLPQASAPMASASRLDKAMRTVVQKYPELIGPEQDRSYSVFLAVSKDGAVLYSSALPTPAEAWVASTIASRPATTIPDAGHGTAGFAKGQSIGAAGKASGNILVSYHMLPADYDESRAISRVGDAVREKHNDPMVRETAVVEGQFAPFEWTRFRIVANDFMADTSFVSLLTVFMTEDGKIAREVVERTRVEELQSVYPKPVDEWTISMRTPPYNSFNPPPVPPEAFKVLGLEPGQIGATGYAIVRKSANLQVMPQGVVVRYAWPRRPGEPIGGRGQ